MQNNQMNVLTELCLRYPESLGLHKTINHGQALAMLTHAHRLAATVPFQWSYIDKPPEGAVFIVFLLPQQPHFPIDGIRYQDQEQRYSMPIDEGRQEIEVFESKYGFVPEQDAIAYRVRRRFRLSKGGNPQLMLVHYSSGQQMAIMPNLRGQPVRAYPLRSVNEPAMYVAGENMGRKVPVPPMAAGHPGRPPVHPMGAQAAMPGMVGIGGGVRHQAAMLAHQNREMEAMDRRQVRDRAGAMPVHTSHVYDEDSGDEFDHISTRSLALARYKRNHDIMNAIFMHAAFGDKTQKPVQNAYSCFDEKELNEKISKLQKEVDDLKGKADERRQQRFGQTTQDDISMDSLAAAPEGVLT